MLLNYKAKVLENFHIASQRNEKIHDIKMDLQAKAIEKRMIDFDAAIDRVQPKIDEIERLAQDMVTVLQGDMRMRIILHTIVQTYYNMEANYLEKVVAARKSFQDEISSLFAGVDTNELADKARLNVDALYRCDWFDRANNPRYSPVPTQEGIPFRSGIFSQQRLPSLPTGPSPAEASSPAPTQGQMMQEDQPEQQRSQFSESSASSSAPPQNKQRSQFSESSASSSAPQKNQQRSQLSGKRDRDRDHSRDANYGGASQNRVSPPRKQRSKNNQSAQKFGFCRYKEHCQTLHNCRFKHTPEDFAAERIRNEATRDKGLLKKE